MGWFALWAMLAAGAQEGPVTDGPSVPGETPPWASDPTVEELAAAADAALDALLRRHQEVRRQDQLRGMSALLVWSVGNLGVGAAGWAVAEDPEWVAFHQMSVAWSAINIGLAVPGLVGALRAQPGEQDLLRSLRADAGMRTTFALNAGLDVGWVGLGAWMSERGLRTGDPRLTGFGRSMMMQGGFLLVFDTTMWLVRAGRDGQLMLQPELAPGRIGLRIGGTLGGPREP